MPIGKYKGTAMIDVPASYLIWISDNPNGYGRHPEGKKVLAYIEDNMDALKLEISKKGKR